MGLEKIPLYQYDENGKYIRSYESYSEVFEKYFDNKKGRLFEDNKEYRELPDGTFIAKYRIGRAKLLKLKKIYNCVFCSKNITDKKISAYNLLGVKVAEFENMRVLQELTGINYNTIMNSIRSRKGTPHKNLRYRFS